MKKFLSLAILGVFVISFVGESSAMYGVGKSFVEEAEYSEPPTNGYDEHILWAPRQNPQAEVERAAAYRAELENKEAMGIITEREQEELRIMRFEDNGVFMGDIPPLDIDFLDIL